MNNRLTGLSLIAVSVASIAYQMVKQHRENVEAERQARVNLQKLDQLTKHFNDSLDTTPDSLFNEVLTSFREKHSGESENSDNGQLI